MTPEQQHQFVGHLRAIESSMKAAIDELPAHENMHAFDLLVISRDALHRAITLMWGKAPELPNAEQDR